MATGEGASLAQQADRLIEHAQDPDLIALLALGDKVFRIQDGLELFGGFLMESLSARLRARARNGAAGLERWVVLLGRIEQNFARASGLNLEPRQTVLTVARDLAHVARGGQL